MREHKICVDVVRWIGKNHYRPTRNTARQFRELGWENLLYVLPVSHCNRADMANKFDGLTVDYSSELPTLDVETATRSVVVSNIADEAGEDDIIIHFQKRKHGGGDIERLHIVEETTTAVVTFDSAERK